MEIEEIEIQTIGFTKDKSCWDNPIKIEDEENKMKNIYNAVGVEK